MRVWAHTARWADLGADRWWDEGVQKRGERGMPRGRVLEDLPRGIGVCAAEEPIGRMLEA